MSADALARSAPLILLDTVWHGANEGTSHSWERLNHAMRDALRLAIGAGLKFEPGDWAEISRSYRFGRWIGDEGEERCYALAIHVGNMTAVKSIEAAWGRRPFIANRVTPGRADHDYLHGGGQSERRRCRLAVGFRFPWEGAEVVVTSFAADYDSLTACSYRREGDYDKCPACDHPRNRPKAVLDRRYTITHAGLRAARRAAADVPAEGGETSGEVSS